MKKDMGFTLIELMVGIALLAIVLGMAVPSFTLLVKNNRQVSQANDFIATINYARTEAIKRNLNVVICRSSNGTSCATASGGWEQGWIVYADVNGNSSLDAGEELKVSRALAGGATMRANANYANSITYRPKGYVSQAGALVLCDDRNGDGDTQDPADFADGRAIIISSTGRPRVESASPTFSNCGT